MTFLTICSRRYPQHALGCPNSPLSLQESLPVRCKSAMERELLLRAYRRSLAGQIPDLAGAVRFLAGGWSSCLLVSSEVLLTFPPPLHCLPVSSLKMQNPFVSQAAEGVTVSTPELWIDLLTLICTWEMITAPLLFACQ